MDDRWTHARLLLLQANNELLNQSLGMPGPPHADLRRDLEQATALIANHVTPFGERRVEAQHLAHVPDLMRRAAGQLGGSALQQQLLDAAQQLEG